MPLHYELRLELDGVLKSRAVSRGRAWCLARSGFPSTPKEARRDPQVAVVPLLGHSAYRCKPQMRAVRFHRPVGSKLSVGTKFATSWTRAATTAQASRWISLPVRRSQYYAHRAVPACLCHLCSPHRRHCGFCPSAAEGCAAGGDVEGFPIRRSVTRARGRCKRCGSSLITRAHWGAPRERLWICKQDVFKDKPARRRLEICAIQ
jgi:hypothetical protein